MQYNIDKIKRDYNLVSRVVVSSIDYFLVNLNFILNSNSKPLFLQSIDKWFFILSYM